MRYLIITEEYIEAENDAAAIKLAKKIAGKRRKKYDNQAKVNEVWKTPFASLNTKKLL